MGRPNNRCNAGSLFGDLRLTNVRQEPGVGGAALGVIGTGFLETELAVDGKAHFRCVVVFLPVVFPPANRAKFEGCRSIESLVSATRATEANFDCGIHTGIDGKSGARDYDKQLLATSF